MPTLLSDDQLESWARDGYLRLCGFLSAAEAAEVATWVDEIASWPDSDDRWMHHREETPSGIRLSRSENFMPFHDGMRRLLTEGEVIDARPRRALYLAYNAAAEGDLHDEYYADKRRTFAATHASGSGTSGRISKIGHFQGKTVTT